MKFKHILILLASILFINGCSSYKPMNFNIVKGLNNDQLIHIRERYDLLVVNGNKLNNEDIKLLHNKHKKIYSYIDIGATSSNKYKDIYLKQTISKKKYYVNVNDKRWQDDIINTINKQKQLGIDGFFFDHLDIYDIDKNLYDGLLSIIKNTRAPIIVNNAMSFMKTDMKLLHQYIEGINQENLFTYWNHKKNKREDVPLKTSRLLKSYLDTAYNYNYNIYVVDFTKKSDWHAVIKAYCKKHHFNYLISKSTSYNKP